MSPESDSIESSPEVAEPAGGLTGSVSISPLSASQELMLRSAPKIRRQLLQRVYDGVASPRETIKAKCLECCGWETASAATCDISSCPLWAMNQQLFAKERAAEEE